MKIETKDFRVRRGEKLKLEKRPTRVKPFFLIDRGEDGGPREQKECKSAIRHFY